MRMSCSQSAWLSDRTNERFLIKTENWSPQHETEFTIKVEQDTKDYIATSTPSNDKDFDMKDFLKEIKIEETEVQINTVELHTCNECNSTYDGLASYQVHLKIAHGTSTEDQAFLLRHTQDINKTGIGSQNIIIKDTKDYIAISTPSNDKDSDMKDFLKEIKIEETEVQINTVELHTCNECNSTYDGLASYQVHLKIAHGTSTEDQAFLLRHTQDINKTGIGSQKLRKIAPKPMPHSNPIVEARVLGCGKCKNYFSRKDALKRHLPRCLGPRSKVSCRLCCKIFSRGDNLHRHLILHHSEGVLCHICGILFKTRRGFCTHGCNKIPVQPSFKR